MSVGAKRDVGEAESALPRRQRLREVEFAGALPMTAAGKLRRYALREADELSPRTV